MISDIVNTYDFYLDMISSYSSFLKDNIDRNLRSFSVHPWSIDYYEKKVTQGYIDYLFTDEHRGRVAHHVTLVIGPWKNTLIAYQDDVKDILERINISNYR